MKRLSFRSVPDTIEQTLMHFLMLSVEVVKPQFLSMERSAEFLKPIDSYTGQNLLCHVHVLRGGHFIPYIPYAIPIL